MEPNPEADDIFGTVDINSEPAHVQMALETESVHSPVLEEGSKEKDLVLSFMDKEEEKKKNYKKKNLKVLIVSVGLRGSQKNQSALNILFSIFTKKVMCNPSLHSRSDS